MFWNPNTWAGLTSRFSGGEVLLPSYDYLGNPQSTNHHYGHPSVCSFDGKYFMTAHESPDALNFKKHWWGVSPDGRSWTWYQLFEYTGAGNLNIPGLTLQPHFVAGNWYLYGFMELSSNEGIGIGAVRLRINTMRSRGYDKLEFFTWS